jgi:predicted acyltransferase
MHPYGSRINHALAISATVVTIVSWVYAALRPIIRPSRTPYYDLFTLYLAQLIAACVGIYESFTLAGQNTELSSGQFASGLSASISLVGVVVILNMPLTVVRNIQVENTVGWLPLSNEDI